MDRNFELTDFPLITGLPFYINKGTLTGSFPCHTHGFSELMIVVGGSARHEVGEDKYPIHAGDAFIIKGDAAHRFTDAEELQHFNIMFAPEEVLSQAKWLKQLPGFHTLFYIEPYYRKEHKFKSKLSLSAPQMAFVKELLGIMEADYHNGSVDLALFLYSSFITLIAYLSRQYLSEPGAASERMFRLAEAVAYIESHFTEPISVMELSAITNLSSRHFTRIFRKIYKSSPMDYIIGMRLDKAAYLLRHSDFPITRIAGDCGFSDSAFFSKQFKKRMNAAPVKYRARYLGR